MRTNRVFSRHQVRQGSIASSYGPPRFTKWDGHSPDLQDCSGAIANLRDAFLFGAMGATVDGAVFFHPVTDHMRTAMRTSGGERLDCTFKAVKDVTLAVQGHLERLVIIIPTSFAYRHG